MPRNNDARQTATAPKLSAAARNLRQWLSSPFVKDALSKGESAYSVKFYGNTPTGKISKKTKEWQGTAVDAKQAAEKAAAWAYGGMGELIETVVLKSGLPVEYATINVPETCPLFARNGERVEVATKEENGVISVLPEVWAGGYFLNRDQYIVDGESAEYRVYFHPIDSAVESYGFTNCISDAFVQAKTDEEAVALAGPMSRLISVTRLAHIPADIDFDSMSDLQVRAAKRIIREQMSRGEVTRTSFDYLVATIDGHDAVEFLETNFAACSDGAYHFRGLTLKIYWAGQSSGILTSRAWRIVRTFTPKPEGVDPSTWNREQDRYSCEESILKAKGADVLSGENVGAYSALPEYVTIKAEAASELSQFNGQRVKIVKALKEGSVKIGMTEDGEASTAYLMTDQYVDRSTNPTQGMSTLHNVAYTPEAEAKEGDIVRGPKTLFKVASFGWNPKTHPGTLDAWRTVGEMMEYFGRYNTAPTGYLFRITVSEFEVNFTSGEMKGMCCFWKDHVQSVRKDPYSESLLNSLK